MSNTLNFRPALQFRRKPAGRHQGLGRREARRGLNLVGFPAFSRSAPPEASYKAVASRPSPFSLGMTFFGFFPPRLKHSSLSVGI